MKSLQFLNQLPLIVRILVLGQLAFALAIILITGHGLATLDYAPYAPAFFVPLAEQVESDSLSPADRSRVVEIVRAFPVEVNGALQLSRHADRTALAVGVCMLFLPLIILLRKPGK